MIGEGSGEEIGFLGGGGEAVVWFVHGESRVRVRVWSVGVGYWRSEFGLGRMEEETKDDLLYGEEGRGGRRARHVILSTDLAPHAEAEISKITKMF